MNSENKMQDSSHLVALYAEKQKLDLEYSEALKQISELRDYKARYYNLCFTAKCLAAFCSPLVFSLFGGGYKIQNLLSPDFWSTFIGVFLFAVPFYFIIKCALPEDFERLLGESVITSKVPTVLFLLIGTLFVILKT